MRRRLPPSRVLLAWLALAALPSVLSLCVAYVLTLRHNEHDAEALANANAARAAGIVAEGGRLLERLAQTTRAECDGRTVAELNRAVSQSLYFRGAGIERGQQLVCTQFGMVSPPRKSDRTQRLPFAVNGSLELFPPMRTWQGGPSIVVNYRVQAKDDRAIHLLLDPRALGSALDHYENQDVRTYLTSDHGRTLTPLDSAVRSGTASPMPPLAPGVRRTAEGLYAIARSADLPLYTVVFTGKARLREHRRAQFWPALWVGFAFTVLAWFLLRRVLPRRDESDDLRQGMAGGELEVWYQPIVDARDHALIGAEALVRWRHPERGLVMPDDFIPLAERSGLIEALTEFVLEQVKRDLDALAPGPGAFRISVNLSRAHLSDGRLIGVIDRVFGAGARLDRLGIEVTERELLTPVMEHARAVLSTLAARGAQIALDDFGTGYSGLSHLRHLPLDLLKIDRSFIWALDTEAVTAHLVDSIASLARSLKIKLVAEGVETAGQRQRLLERGVYLQQGSLYADAMPLAALRDWLRRGYRTAVLPDEKL